ncbi:hypothetical protein HPB50_006421 [Hyalomma asiaticum]|uniref:Uncharacterized protein n=1 Tax=Hyalomma asiaticum TaxID=266040 RepID=A0ACB7S514_HYAAI|nr:hypothetical protein HPB50_006421 [Hyalomma asiaticum]
MFSFCIRNGIVPDVVRRLFAGFLPSIGHITRLCKILKAEHYRQARLYRQLLAALLFDCGDALRASSRHHKYLRIADRTTEFIWNLQLAHLRNEVKVKSPAPKHQVHTLEPLDLPPAVIRVLSLGPKFAVEPKRSPHELLSFVHRLSQHAPLACSDEASCQACPDLPRRARPDRDSC